MKKIVLSIVIGFIHVASFGQDVLSDFQSNIIGVWNWEQTETAGTSSENWVSPSICNCSKKMVISDNRKYQYFENGKLIYSGDYYLVMNGSDQDNVKYLFVGSYFNFGMFLTDDDKLRLGSTSGCGDIFVYTRW